MYRIREHGNIMEKTVNLLSMHSEPQEIKGKTNKFTAVDCPQTDNKCTISNSLPMPKKRITLTISSLKFWNDNV